MRGWSHMTTPLAQTLQGALYWSGPARDSRWSRVQPPWATANAPCCWPHFTTESIADSKCSCTCALKSTHTSHTSCPTQESRLESMILKVIFFYMRAIRSDRLSISPSYYCALLVITNSGDRPHKRSRQPNVSLTDTGKCNFKYPSSSGLSPSTFLSFSVSFNLLSF